VTSDRLNWLLTVTANLGVILGLGFLAVELRQNTLATQATLNIELLAIGRENAELLLSDDELAEIVLRAEQDPGSLSLLEREKFLLFTSWRMGVWETAFMNADEGIVADRYFEGFDAWYSVLVRRGPGYKYWWDESRHGYDPAFQEHVDRVFESAP
jgi:hypothetical protein